MGQNAVRRPIGAAGINEEVSTEVFVLSQPLTPLLFTPPPLPARSHRGHVFTSGSLMRMIFL